MNDFYIINNVTYIRDVVINDAWHKQKIEEMLHRGRDLRFIKKTLKLTWPKLNELMDS